MVLETTALPTELYPCDGGEGGIRTHAPVTQSNGLANRPLEPRLSKSPSGGRYRVRTCEPLSWLSAFEADGISRSPNLPSRLSSLLESHFFGGRSGIRTHGPFYRSTH